MAFASDKTRQGAAGVSSGGYEIDNSLRFNDDDSAYLSWTPSSAGNRKTWTWSGWVKRSEIGSRNTFFSAHSSTEHTLRFEDDQIQVYRYSGGYTWKLTTSAVYRDVSAWYHIVWATDTTQSTSSNRVKLYVNGEQITDFDEETYPSQNSEYHINDSVIQYLGRSISGYFDGYLAEVNFIDGQALTPADFGETGDYGEWKPIEYTGTYGTNGFYLDFSDSAALGDDAANSNDFTVNNLTASDQMVDSPTNNFATFNPLDHHMTNLLEGNLETWATGWGEAPSTFWMTTGKWYWEMYLKGETPWNDSFVGMVKGATKNTHSDYDAGRMAVSTAGTWFTEALGAAADFSGTASSFTDGALISCTFDADAGIFKIYKDNVLMGTSSSTSEYATATEGWKAYVGGYTNTAWVANFGQDSSFAGNKTAQGNQDSNSIGDFYYTPPTDFLALCTSNLPAVAVVPSEHFNTVLWTGNGSTQSITGVGFEPSLVWGRGRSYGYGLGFFDQVRGATKTLNGYLTDAEYTQSGLTSFDSDGFSLGSTWGNISGRTQVAWNWKANGSGSSNTDGSITSTVSANADAGFSIVSYTGASNATTDLSNNGGNYWTIGHGLSKAPELILVKKRSSGAAWYMGLDSLGSTPWVSGSHLVMNTTAAMANDAGYLWGNGTLNSSTFEVGGWNVINRNGSTYIAYCFHSVDGYSKVGSYTGNGSTDGTFVYTGFRPAYVMIKRSDGTSNWELYDIARNPYNGSDLKLYPNLNAAEGADAGGDGIDHLSNGFKLRSTTGGINVNTGAFIYLAFAEVDFKHSTAR